MTSPAEPSRAAGFTLLETLIVVAILGLVLTLFASRGADHGKTLNLRRTADSLAEDLRLARTEAIVHGRPASVTLKTSPPGWSDADGTTTSLPADISLAASTSTAFGAAAATDTVRFQPDGSSSGGEITLSDGSRKLLIAIDWLAGGVSVTQAP
jgi:general secretion pathway protein H